MSKTIVIYPERTTRVLIAVSAVAANDNALFDKEIRPAGLYKVVVSRHRDCAPKYILNTALDYFYQAVSIHNPEYFNISARLVPENALDHGAQYLGIVACRYGKKKIFSKKFIADVVRRFNKENVKSFKPPNISRQIASQDSMRPRRR